MAPSTGVSRGVAKDTFLFRPKKNKILRDFTENPCILDGMTYPNYRHWLIRRITSRTVMKENGCIEYGVNGWAHKYGLVSITLDKVSKSVPAHRAMWMAANDRLDLPSSVYILHSCDNPRCVNLDHLRAGTPKEKAEAEDCVSGERRARQHKPHSRVRVVSDETIRAIRAATGSNRSVACEFRVSPGYASRIRSGKAKGLVV